MKEIIGAILLVFIGIVAVAIAITGLVYPINVLSCSSETAGMDIKSHEYRFWADACMVQLNDGHWVPLTSYRSFKVDGHDHN